MVDLVGRDMNVGHIPTKFHVRRADQRVAMFLRNGEDNPLVGVLEDVCVIMIEQLARHDMTPFDQPYSVSRGADRPRSR
jgi:hypothetical protein